MSLADVPVEEVAEWAAKISLGVWIEQRRGFDLAPHHWEWCRIATRARRAVVVAPRDSAKSETFAVSAPAWRSIRQPGHWTYVFSDTADQAKSKLERIVAALDDAAPWMVEGASERNSTQWTFANGSKVTVAGAGKSVRGDHPDLIVGDDVLEESKTATAYQRAKTLRWWLGTVANMAHPGTLRVGREFGPTRIHLIGTPFHHQDLLARLRDNDAYEFYRYSAEFSLRDLVPGSMAVEVRRGNALTG